MNLSNIFKLIVKKPICSSKLSEDDQRALADSLGLEINDEEFEGFVTISNVNGARSKVFVGFDSSGNVSNIFAKENGGLTKLLPPLGLFPGAPSANNPGQGWEVDVELTNQFFPQSANEDEWKIFVARRTAVINNF